MSVQVRISADNRDAAMKTLVDLLALLPPTMDVVVTMDVEPALSAGGIRADRVFGEPDSKEIAATGPTRIVNAVDLPATLTNNTGASVGIIPLPPATAEHHAGILHGLLSKVVAVIGLAANPAVVAAIPDPKIRACASVVLAVEEQFTGGTPGMPVL